MKCLFCNSECQYLEDPVFKRVICDNHFPITVTFVENYYYVMSNNEYRIVVYYDDFYENYDHRFSFYFGSKCIVSSNTIPTISPTSFEEKVKKLMVFS